MKEFIVNFIGVMSLFAIFYFLLMLSGCTVNPPKTVEAKVSVPVKCVPKTIERPQFASDVMPLNVDIWQAVHYLWIDHLQRKSYEKELLAAMEGCK